MKNDKKPSKYLPLWEHVAPLAPVCMSFDEIAAVLGFEIDHSFLTYKAEAVDFGVTVKKISLKNKTVMFERAI